MVWGWGDEVHYKGSKKDVGSPALLLQLRPLCEKLVLPSGAWAKEKQKSKGSLS